MRAWDITLLIICFELALGFTSGIGLWGYTYYEPSQENVLDVVGYQSGNMNATTGLIDSMKQQNADYFSLGTMLMTSIGILFNVLGAIVFFYPHLVNTFMFPMALAIPIQALIYLTYSWAIAQFLSGRSGSLIQ